MSPRPPARTGLGAIDAERFNVASAVGGWRGVIESAAPTLVFVVVMAVRPSALVAALAASLAVSGAALAARLAQRQGLTQVLGGAVLALVSAAWAWRSGEASNFYATGLLINAAWLAGCLLSLAAGRPLVGILMGLWRAAAGGGSARPDGGADAEDAVVAVGLNCVAPAVVDQALPVLRAATDKPLVAYPNSGDAYDPVAKTWRPVRGPERFTRFTASAPAWLDAGVRLIGGCCRTTPVDTAVLHDLVVGS